MQARFFFGLALIGLGFGAGSSPAQAPARAGTRYYVLLFGGQADRLRPRTAHTWATWVKAETRPDGGVSLEAVTISWLPCRMPVRPFAFCSEPGRNYGLHETLDIFDAERTDLSLWGPFEIRESWFNQAVAHKAFLDSGAARFKTFDGTLLATTHAAGPWRPGLSHCVHSVTRTDEALRQASQPITWFGDLITRKVAQAMARVGLLVNPAVTHDWLILALGIEHYPMVRRRIGDPFLAFVP